MNYWENEQPAVADTGKNVIRYFAGAGKVQISMAYWTDAKGEQKPGKTVTLDIAALRETPEAMAIFKQIAAGA